MRFGIPIFGLVGFLLPAVLSAASDSIKVTDHSVFGVGNKASREPKAIVLTLEVEYSLKSKPKVTLLFVIDREAEMNFSLADQREVIADKKPQKLKVTAKLEGFSRPILHGIVLLRDPDAPPGSPPLAQSGISLDVKKFKQAE